MVMSAVIVASLPYSSTLQGQKWTGVEIVDLGEECTRAALRGCNPSSKAPSELLHVVPCSLNESLSMDLLVPKLVSSQQLFISFQNHQVVQGTSTT